MQGHARLQALIAGERWEEAERHLRRAVRAKGAPAEAFYNLAKVLEAAGKPEQAPAWLAKAVARRPDYAIAWFEIGRHALDRDRLEEAEHAFANAAHADPSDGDARRLLTRTRLRLGMWQATPTALGNDADREARLIRYRATVEMGEEASVLKDALLSDPEQRPAVIRAMTRTARGRIPLRLPPLRPQSRT